MAVLVEARLPTVAMDAALRAVRRWAALAVLGAVLGACETVPQDSPELSIEPVVQPAAPGTVDLAERALEEERYGDAKQLLERVLISDPENARARLLSAELLLATGTPDRAAAAFGKLTEVPEVRIQALQGAGISLLLIGKKKEGRDSLLAALDADPGLWRAWNALGYYHDSVRDWGAAVASYAKAIEINPDSALVHNNRGFSRFMQGRLEEAIDDFERALALDSDLELAQQNLRLALAWTGRYIHAMSGVSETEMAKALNNVGFIAILRGDYGNAEAYLTRAMELDPSYNEVASRNLAYLNQVRDLEKAESAPKD